MSLGDRSALEMASLRDRLRAAVQHEAKAEFEGRDRVRIEKGKEKSRGWPATMGIASEGRGQRSRRQRKRVIRVGALHVVLLRSCHVGRCPPLNSSLWPTLFVQDSSLSPTPSSLIASSSTHSLQPLQYLPPSSMPSKIRVTSTPWPSTSQRAARAFWSHSLVFCLSVGNLTLLSFSDSRQL